MLPGTAKIQYQDLEGNYWLTTCLLFVRTGCEVAGSRFEAVVKVHPETHAIKQINSPIFCGMPPDTADEVGYFNPPVPMPDAPGIFELAPPEHKSTRYVALEARQGHVDTIVHAMRTDIAVEHEAAPLSPRSPTPQ
jgi:hypothetical protein